MAREENCKQISLACVGSALSVPPHWVCPCSWCVCFPSLPCSGSRLLCQELSVVGPGLHALPRSKSLRVKFWGTSQRRRLGWACIFWPFQLGAAQVTRCLASTVAPHWRLLLNASPIPTPRFSECTMGVHSQVCRVSLLGSWSLVVTLQVDVEHPESQEVFIHNESCLQFARGCLSGVAIASFQLWLPSPACLWWGMGQSTAG